MMSLLKDQAERKRRIMAKAEAIVLWSQREQGASLDDAIADPLITLPALLLAASGLASALTSKDNPMPPSTKAMFEEIDAWVQVVMHGQVQ